MITASESARQSAQPKQRSARLYRDASALAVASLAAAVFGAAFWAVAAKMYPPEQVGVMTAILAVINAVGMVVAAAAGDAYTALLPAVGPQRSTLYRRGRRRHWVLVVGAGAVAAIGTVTFLPEVRGSAGVALLVFAGVAVWSTFMLQNSTLTAVGRATWLPAANIGASAGRILLLPLFAVFIGWHSVELAFIVAAAVVVAALWRPTARSVVLGAGLSGTATIPEDRAVREFDRIAAQMVVVALLGVGITMLSPFLVTVFAGPSAGAVFALCMTLAQLVDFVTTAMCVSLVVHAAETPEHGRSMARAVLVRALLLAVGAASALTLVVPHLLPLLNRQYAEMNTALVIGVLSAATVVRVFYQVWAELQRSRRRMGAPLAVNMTAAIVLFCAMPWLATNYGAVGGALAILALRVVHASGAGLSLALSSLTTRRSKAV